MATQMQQPVSTRLGRISVRTLAAVVGIVGVVGVGSALLGCATPAPMAAPVVRRVTVPLGIALPAGATRAELPAGVTDDLRTPAMSAMAAPVVTNLVLGIDAPIGVDRSELPFG